MARIHLKVIVWEGSLLTVDSTRDTWVSKVVSVAVVVAVIAGGGGLAGSCEEASGKGLACLRAGTSRRHPYSKKAHIITLKWGR